MTEKMAPQHILAAMAAMCAEVDPELVGAFDTLNVPDPDSETMSLRRAPRGVKSPSVALERLAALMPDDWLVTQSGRRVSVYLTHSGKVWWANSGTGSRLAAIGFLADILMMPTGSGTGCLGLTPEAIQATINWDTVLYPSIAGLSCHEEHAVERLLAVKDTRPMQKKERIASRGE